MKKKEILVLKVEPGKNPEVSTLRNELGSLQEAVGGLIEVISLDATSCILCNEEGKLIGLEPNRRFYGDILAGTFYVLGCDRDGDFASLTTAQLERYTQQFWEPQQFEEGVLEDYIFMDFIPFEKEDVYNAL